VFDHLHLLLVVVVASSGREVVEPVDLLGTQLDGGGGAVLLDARDALGPGYRGDVVPPSQDPCQGNLGRGGTNLGGDRLDLVNGTQIALEVLANKTGAGLTRIVVREVVG